MRCSVIGFKFPVHSPVCYFCLLGNEERPQFLKLEYLHKTFALKLIEGVLMNNCTANSSAGCVSLSLYLSETCMPTAVLKSLSCLQHSVLLLYLQHHLECSAFPLALGGTRFAFLLLK